MIKDLGLKKIRVEGHRHKRTLTCPYCGKLVRVTLVTHLRNRHPEEWDVWTEEFVRLYNETNDLKRVMRAFSTSDGQPILSWTVIDRELKRRLEGAKSSVRFLEKEAIPRWGPIEGEYKRFETTVWDIPRRGGWGVHQATYRGNWAPQVARALLEHYTKAGDRVLDPFVGGGTTLLEAWDLGRHAFGYDVSDFALELTRARLEEFRRRAGRESLFGLPDVEISVQRGDARFLPDIKSEEIDFVCTHPPYGSALKYSHDDPSDLSLIEDPVVFMEELTKAGRRFFEVLKAGGYCGLLIGDMRKNGKLHTFGFETLRRFTDIGFDVEDVIIKTQNQDRSTEFYFKNSPVRFRLNHEYLLVFKKPQ